MSRKRIVKIAMQISSADIKARVEVKVTNVQRVEQQITFITPKENFPGECNFTWIINERSSR